MKRSLIMLLVVALLSTLLVPAMAEQVEPCRKRGLILKNVRKVTLDHVRYEGIEGDWIDAENAEVTEER